MTVRPMTVRPIALVFALALAGLLGGCSAASDSSNSSGSSAASAAVAPNPAAKVDSAAASGAAGANAGANDASGVAAADGTATDDDLTAQAASPSARRRVQTAAITLEVSKLPAATANVRSTAVALGGLVTAESSGFLPDPNRPDPNLPTTSGSAESGSTGSGTADALPTPTDGQSVLTVRVPEPALDQALARLAKVGHEIDLSTSSQDVTATIADLNSRVSSQTRSVARVRDLLDRATSLKDVVLIESELAKRESNLEALQARQRALGDQADLATITVILQTPPVVAATTGNDDGFRSGLRRGWHAVKVSTTVVLTVLGAVLPVVLVLALLGWPGYLVSNRIYRRIRTHRQVGT